MKNSTYNNVTAQKLSRLQITYQLHKSAAQPDQHAVAKQWQSAYRSAVNSRIKQYMQSNPNVSMEQAYTKIKPQLSAIAKDVGIRSAWSDHRGDSPEIEADRQVWLDKYLRWNYDDQTYRPSYVYKTPGGTFSYEAKEQHDGRDTSTVAMGPLIQFKDTVTDANGNKFHFWFNTSPSDTFTDDAGRVYRKSDLQPLRLSWSDYHNRVYAPADTQARVRQHEIATTSMQEWQRKADEMSDELRPYYYALAYLHGLSPIAPNSWNTAIPRVYDRTGAYQLNRNLWGLGGTATSMILTSVLSGAVAAPNAANAVNAAVAAQRAANAATTATKTTRALDFLKKTYAGAKSTFDAAKSAHPFWTRTGQIALGNALDLGVSAVADSAGYHTRGPFGYKSADAITTMRDLARIGDSTSVAAQRMQLTAIKDAIDDEYNNATTQADRSRAQENRKEIQARLDALEYANPATNGPAPIGVGSAGDMAMQALTYSNPWLRWLNTAANWAPMATTVAGNLMPDNTPLAVRKILPTISLITSAADPTQIPSNLIHTVTGNDPRMKWLAGPTTGYRDISQLFGVNPAYKLTPYGAPYQRQVDSPEFKSIQTPGRNASQRDIDAYKHRLYTVSQSNAKSLPAAVTEMFQNKQLSTEDLVDLIRQRTKRGTDTKGINNAALFAWAGQNIRDQIKDAPTYQAAVNTAKKMQPAELNTLLSKLLGVDADALRDYRRIMAEINEIRKGDPYLAEVILGIYTGVYHNKQPR